MLKLKMNGIRASQYKYVIFCALALLVFFAYFNTYLPQSPYEDSDYRSDQQNLISIFISVGIILCIFFASYFFGRIHEYKYQYGKYKEVKE